VRRRKRKIPIITDLDLHGVKHKDVDITVEDYILMHKPPFKIITGHSNTMKTLTKAVLERHEYKYQDSVLNNLGCILVTSE
jgi:anthranilate phosphoribosyltransferase